MLTTVEQIAELVRATLARPDLDVRPEQLLFYDLSFTSMDLLDLLFRVEDQFGIAITEGTIYRLACGELPEAEFAVDGLLTPLGRERLMAFLDDTPPQIFPPRIDAASLPRYCTVAALGRLVDRLREPPCSS
jgi:acyl carrier protein